MSKSNSTIDHEEIRKFDSMSEEWWDFDGKFKPLHCQNPLRLGFIRDHIESHFKDKKFSDIKILDVGCGGGLISEPLANMGFDVTGIDAGEKNIEIAKAHARKTGTNLEYKCELAENLHDRKYDVVVALEIIEHVSDVEFFLDTIANLLSDGGIMFVSTINKNLKSYLSAIVAAEYVLRLLPVGTHSFEKFIRPSAIIKILGRNRLNPISIKGISFNIFKQKFELTSNPDVNYIIALKK